MINTSHNIKKSPCKKWIVELYVFCVALPFCSSEADASDGSP